MERHAGVEFIISTWKGHPQGTQLHHTIIKAPCRLHLHLSIRAPSAQTHTHALRLPYLCLDEKTLPESPKTFSRTAKSQNEKLLKYCTLISSTCVNLVLYFITVGAYGMEREPDLFEGCMHGGFNLRAKDLPFVQTSGQNSLEGKLRSWMHGAMRRLPTC